MSMLCCVINIQSFGAPYIVVHMENGKKEGFFGSDRMELMADVIGEGVIVCMT